jgi:hypothetical protein
MRWKPKSANVRQTKTGSRHWIFALIEASQGDEIAQRLHNVYGQDAYCRASVFRWIEEVGRGKEELRDENRPGYSRYEVDPAIRSILQDEPNAWLWTIGETLSISPETVRTDMTRMGYTLKALRWIPYTLTSQQKRIRLTICIQLLPKLRAHAHNNWHCHVTGDESWFYREYVRDRTWMATDENTPVMANRTIASEKACRPFYGIPAGSMLRRCCHRELPPMRRGSLTKTWSLCRIDSFKMGEIQGKKLVVHIDNVSAPRCEGDPQLF